MQNKIYVLTVNIWLIQFYFISNEKLSSLSGLALIYKSIKFTKCSSFLAR